MTQPILALMKKLNRQLNEFSFHLQSVENASLEVICQLQELEKELHPPSPSPLPMSINPEFEINRLNYITQKQRKKDELELDLKNHKMLEDKLKDKILRVKTELNMLEKYFEREQQVQKRQQQIVQDNALDEWVIQQKEPA
ncbi:hypothetical protein EP47_09215 [Legionella norrlandica]|uniref:Flagellar FliJ protein n=1 Tax=Legionella norrlandica TaxID=1498499 RepID=A0A0A2SUA3_9GAMM|nr:hypothetical protein [Legionella norrlandica]KGP63301.1 hypothetical protein EP47_09215 [Legionella norrlandica]